METVTHSHEHHSYHLPKYEKSRCSKVLAPLGYLVDAIPVKNSRFAHLICQVIPCCCPFERDIKLFGRSFHIPSMCKLNPLYDNFVGLRFRALAYLSDDCGEDVTKYIC